MALVISKFDGEGVTTANSVAWDNDTFAWFPTPNRQRMMGYDLGEDGTVTVDTARRRLCWDHPTRGTRYGPVLPYGMWVRSRVEFPGLGDFTMTVYLTPPHPGPSSRERSAYRRRQLARRRRNRR